MRDGMQTARRFVLAALVLAGLTAAAQEPDPIIDEFTKAAFFGQKFYELKEYDNAFQQFVRADTLKPDQPAVLYNMALLLAKVGRYSEAQGKLDRYRQLHANGVELPLVTKLQLELEFQRELQKKRQADKEYLELFTRGRFLYGRGELAAALPLFQEAEQRRPNDAAAVYDQAVIHEKLGDFARAVERFRRYLELETDAAAKSATDQHVLTLESELADMKSKIVCSFCGLRLPIGSTWCHRCWHGPYLVNSAVWNTRPCIEGASATRATFFAGDRFNRNDGLSCLWNGTMLEVLRYAPAKQRSIQEARRAEGWTYNGDILQGWRDKVGNEVRYVQGPDYLERIESPTGGEVLTYSAHRSGEVWLLDREEVILDGQKYTSRYTFDDGNRITRQEVEYQNATGCNHLITASADYVYEGGALTGARLTGGYDGFPAEGSPRVDWQASLAFSHDTLGRVVKEDLSVGSFTKTYATKPHGALRNDISSILPSMRVKRPLDLSASGDLCGTLGRLPLANPIDLRPFYAISPNLNMALPPGVMRATVSLTYPDSFTLR